jgi:hypothetical protein
MYDGQSAIAVVDSRDGEELVALAHDGRCCEGRVEISWWIGRQYVLIPVC